MTEPTATGLYAQQQHAPGTVLAGRFRIESMLGIGGMGVVYRATDLTLDVVVALKLLRPELATRPEAFERFRQELLMARQVSSPRVVRIHDLAQHDGQWLISMDYIEGEGLERRLDREGAMAPDVAVGIARQLAEGLSAAHARGVVHRDLKPANVLIDRGGNAYISDFGVARSLASNGLTQSGAVVGTPDYLSPEQARGDSVDARSDLYALGLILYEMLTGSMPFQGGTISEILAQRMLRSPPPVTQAKPQTPAWLARLVDRLLRVQPAHRLQSADAVISAIDGKQVPRDWRPTRRQWLWAAVAAAIVAVGAALLWRSPRPVMPEGVVTVAPLHRLVVMPIEAGTPQARAAQSSALPPARTAALTALLRDAIAAVPGVAVADGERTQQALRQLDPTGAATIDTRILQRVIGADRVLRVTLRESKGRWHAHATLANGSDTPISGSGTTTLGALAALLQQPAFATALNTAGRAPSLALPDCDATCTDQALDLYGRALEARRNSAPADALPLLQQASKRAPRFAANWLALAEVAQAVGEADVAYDAIERGQAVATKAAPGVQRRFQAERALLDGDAPAAAAQWRAQMAATPDDTYAELALARALGAGGEFKPAIEALQRLVARDPNDPRAWFELGKFSILAGQARRAVDDYLVRALVLFKRSGNRYGEAETANALGIGYARLGQSNDAEEQYRKAVELRRAVGNRRGLATSLRNLGNILSQRGKFDEAASALKQSGELHAALGDRAGLAAVESEAGVLAEERGDYVSALASFRSALQSWQQLGEKSGTAQVLNDIGFAHYQLGGYDDAQAYLVQAANAFAELGDDTGRIRTQQNLGLLAIARGQWNEARRQLDASLQAAEQQQMLEEAAVSRRNLAELEWQQGHIDAALAQATTAEHLFREREDWRGLADSGLIRVQALMAVNADARAREALSDLDSAIAQSSAEQRGIAALLQSELARRAGDSAATDRAWQDARQFAEASGVQQLALRVALQKQDPHRLDAATAQLGNVPLRLEWAQAAMTAALSARDLTRAAAVYKDIAPLLRRGDSVQAMRLHDLGATTLANDASASASAASRACAALAALQAHTPADLRSALVAATHVHALVEQRGCRAQ